MPESDLWRLSCCRFGIPSGWPSLLHAMMSRLFRFSAISSRTLSPSVISLFNSRRIFSSVDLVISPKNTENCSCPRYLTSIFLYFDVLLASTSQATITNISRAPPVCGILFNVHDVALQLQSFPPHGVSDRSAGACGIDGCRKAFDDRPPPGFRQHAHAYLFVEPPICEDVLAHHREDLTVDDDRLE